MHLGALLVLIGTILIGLSLLLGGRPLRGGSIGADAVLAVGAILIGIGVLIGNTTLEAH